ncbi:MAG TPA: PDZ domain-containing protein [Puia sp.]
MNNPLLKWAGLTALVLCLHIPGRAQDAKIESDDDSASIARIRSLDEIVIRHKGDKDAKVTVEIKNGEVFINGKPSSDYKDDNLTITRHKLKSLGSGSYTISDGDAYSVTPFRSYGGTYNYAPRAAKPRRTAVSGAFLGVTSIREENGPEAAKVGEVSEGSAAEKAGLKEGDLITKIDDKPIDGPETLAKVVRGYKPGDKVTITFKRGGKEQKATAELGRSRTTTAQVYGMNGDGDWNWENDDMLRQFNAPKAFVMPRGGYNFSFADNSLRLGIRAQDTEDGKGVKVLDVDDETAAGKAGIKEGDIITRFDGQEVNNATKLAELARAIRDDKSKSTIKISLLRAGKPMEVEVRIPRKLKTADL